jgi:hypothetical protein
MSIYGILALSLLALALATLGYGLSTSWSWWLVALCWFAFSGSFVSLFSGWCAFQDATEPPSVVHIFVRG